MNKETLKELLEKVKKGELSVENAIDGLQDFSYMDLDFAKIDNHRQVRTGYPEVIFGQGKTTEQVKKIVEYMLTKDNNILATRVTREMYEAVSTICKDARYNEQARTISVIKKEDKKPASHIAIVTAGTSDIPVAEEAAITAEVFSNEVKRYIDVGVAGIHRFYDNINEIRKAKVIVVVAGMEGALPSIVGGMVDKPVIAVPTSIGYGASFNGLAALLGMLTSCASGVSVVNIDNGFGAGYLASMINKL